MRRIVLTIAIAVLAVVGLSSIAIATSSGSPITRARLERSVTASFSNIYSQQATLLGHDGISPQSLDAKSMCDKGPGVSPSGPGTGWICLMSWKDPSVPMPSTGYGKFEVTVHTNGCYTVGSPSSLIGYQTITDAAGRTVNNPAYEYDACLNPHGDNTPTGVKFPSALTVTSTTATPDAHGHITVGLACATGLGGCSGTVTVTSSSAPVGTTPAPIGTAFFTMTEEAAENVPVTGTLPTDATQVTYTAHTTSGVAASPVTVSVQR
jgi:hypothetical protein